MLHLCKEISSAMCFPAPMVENAKRFLKNALMFWGIGEEGVEKDAQKEDTLINMLFLINSIYLHHD
jgi:hypothetical protein